VLLFVNLCRLGIQISLLEVEVELKLAPVNYFVGFTQLSLAFLASCSLIYEMQADLLAPLSSLSSWLLIER